MTLPVRTYMTLTVRLHVTLPLHYHLLATPPMSRPYCQDNTHLHRHPNKPLRRRPIQLQPVNPDLFTAHTP